MELKNLLFKIFDYVKFCIEFCMKSGNFSNEIEGLFFCLLESENFVIFSINWRVLLILYLGLILKLKI